MRRQEEISECESLINKEEIDHLHIRKKAIVSDFIDELQTTVERDVNIISVDIAEWDYDEVMETLRWELQRQLSPIRYYISRAVAVTIQGIGSERERKPNYQRVKEYISTVSSNIDGDLVLLVNHHGETPVDGFGWISKLQGLPENTTLLTHGFQRCTRDESKELTVGRLSVQQTTDYLTNERPDLSEEKAAKIHNVHDGNPAALKIALENDELGSPLTGENLDRLWSEVYDDILSRDERDLLYGSAHLVDLDSKDVALSVEMTRGECEDILKNLQSKGVVSQKKSGLFTTDWYVKHYITTQKRDQELSNNHEAAFKNYAEKWIDNYEAQMENSFIENEQTDVQSGSSQQELMNVDLFLAAHHLANAYPTVDQETFITQLEEVDRPSSGVFSFGVFVQRFFFEEPFEVIEKLSESILGMDDDAENTLFSGTLAILMDFDLKGYIDDLSDGWSGDIRTNELPTGTASDPTAVLQSIQNKLDLEVFEHMPTDVRLAVAHFLTVPYADDRTANEYYSRFGKTAEKYGLEEEAYTGWLNELEDLIELLDPDANSQDGGQTHPLEENLDSLDKEIRTRIGLQELLEQNRTEQQQEFQQHLDYIRDRPSQIAEQYISCGEKLAEAENPLFPYLWYLLGHRVLLEIILNQKSTEVYGEYKYWVAKREDYESEFNEDELVITTDIIEERIE